MTNVPADRPLWFRAVAAILLIWGLIGCYSCFEQLRFGADAMGPSNAYDRALYASLPTWYDPCFVVAVLSGTLGAAALLAYRRIAVPLAVVALVAIVVMFGYIFLATDLIAQKGVIEATGFPALVVLIAIGQLWLARHASALGWIG